MQMKKTTKKIDTFKLDDFYYDTKFTGLFSGFSSFYKGLKVINIQLSKS